MTLEELAKEANYTFHELKVHSFGETLQPQPPQGGKLHTYHVVRQRLSGSLNPHPPRRAAQREPSRRGSRY